MSGWFPFIIFNIYRISHTIFHYFVQKYFSKENLIYLYINKEIFYIFMINKIIYSIILIRKVTFFLTNNCYVMSYFLHIMLNK